LDRLTEVASTHITFNRRHCRWGPMVIEVSAHSLTRVYAMIFLETTVTLLIFITTLTYAWNWAPTR
jgi:hypothetical protein